MGMSRKERAEQHKARTIDEADYIVDNKATIRKTASEFNVSKTTVHRDVTRVLARYPEHDSLREKALKVIVENKDDRAFRGGLATSIKYSELRKLKTKEN